MFCVYLTCYRGSKLPPFYIGSTSLENIKSGYRGTVKSKRYKAEWNRETRLNPHLFRTQVVCIYPTEIEARTKEAKFQMQLSVIKSTMYINLTCANMKFGASGENHYLYRSSVSPETRRKISISKKGKKMRPEVVLARRGKYTGVNSPSYGRKHTTASNLKNAQSHLGKKHSDDTKKAMSEDRKTWYWWNNGLLNKRQSTCPGEGWIRGKLTRNQHE